MLEIHVQVTLAEAFPNKQEWEANKALREALGADVGDLTGSGTGGGVMDNWVCVEVDDRVAALARTDEILRRLKLTDRTRVTTRDLTPKPGFPNGHPEIVEQLIALGKAQRNRITFDQLRAHVPHEIQGEMCDAWCETLGSSSIVVAENLSTPTGAGFPGGHPEIVGKLLALGRAQNNRLTHEQLNDCIPDETHSTEQIDAWFDRLGDEGLHFVKDDKVLAHDDEKELARRIEARDDTLVGTVVESSLLLEEFFRLGDQLRAGTLSVKDVARDEDEVDQVCECIEQVRVLQRELTHDLDPTALAAARGQMFKSLSQFRFAAPVIETIETALARESEHDPTCLSAMRALKDAKRVADDATHQLVEANQYQVASYASEHVGQGVQFAELMDAGNIGLRKAVEAYEHRRGYRFSIYARWWIREEIVRRIGESA